MKKKLFVEGLGTFWLVLGGCGSAVLSAKFPETGIGFLGVSFAFGLSLVTIIYALGRYSGGHFNPAVSIGLWVGGKFNAKELIPYILVQLAGACIAAGVLYLIVTGNGDAIEDFAANGYGQHSPGQYALGAAILTEIVMTYIFLMVILGVTSSKKSKSHAALAIGFALTLIHLISIPVTNTSVNPARSTSQAIFVGDWAIGQLWLFWVAPIVGAILAGISFKYFFAEKSSATA